MSLAPGTRLDNYQIVRAVGAGGMGEVYLARDTNLNRTVAIKVLPAEVTSDPHRVARFEHEARAASALNHPNVCTIYGLGRTEDGRRYIAMELVEGETLRAYLTRGRLELRQALDVAIQIASALTASHAAGIVHRDIKPENVMVRPDRLVKVLDFGLAKLTPSRLVTAAHEATRTMHATEPGSLVGTIGYMSPEQARGGDVDTRSDVWALGVVMYEMVAGRPPFTGSTRSDVLVAILDREPIALIQHQAQVPAELQRIVGKALRKDPEERYQVLKDLLLDLKALRGEIAGSSSSGASVTVPVLPRRGRATRLFIGAALLVAVASAGVWWWTRGSATPTSTFVNRPLTRLTFGPGLQTDPTFSPDGRFVAYASDRSGNFDIWVQPIGGGDAVQVTRSPAHDMQPAWSPDGATLAFRSERDGGGLFTVPALGGIERRLASFGTHPIWTTDSKEVLFLSGILPGEALWPMRLYRVSLDGSPAREVLRDFLDRGLWYWIAPHPDGRISAWGAHERLGDGFYTVSVDGKHITSSRISPDIPFPLVPQFSVRRRFRWNAEGTALFIQADASNVVNLWKVRVNSDDLVWTSVERFTTGVGADVLGALSADGKTLAFGTESQSSRLWLFDIAFTRLGDGRPLTEEGTDATFGTLSDDGQSVAYTLRRPGINREETWVAPTSGGTPQLIATNADSPVWSPDGRSLAYGYLRLDGSRVVETRVMIKDLGGGERPASEQLRGAFFFSKQWTKSGRLLGLYGDRAGAPTRLALWPTTRPDAGEPERVLANHPMGSIWQPSFSPNGRSLVFILQRRDQADKVEMFLAPAEGGPPERWTRLASDHSWADKPRWAPDGRTLYFISRRPSAYFKLWGLRFDPERGVPIGEPFQVASFDSPALYISPHLERAEMDVSARHVLLTMKSVTGSIWMLEGVDR